MSFVPNQMENQNAPQGMTTPAPTPTAGSTSSGGTGAKAAPTAPNTASPNQFGSSASNLGAYLSANAPQVQGQANTLANTLNTQYGQVSGDLSNAINGFNQSVSSGYAAPNQQGVTQALSDAQAGNLTPGDISAYQGQANDQYTGPSNFEQSTPYAGIQNEVNTAVSNAGLLSTPAGLQNYFAQNAGPNQTQATNTLDTLLLEGNPGAQQTIQTAANQFQPLTQQFATDTTTADQSVQAAQQAAANAAQYAQGQFNPLVTSFGNTINQDVNNVNTAEQNYNSQLNNFNQQVQPLVQQANIFAGKTGANFGNVNNPFATMQDIVNPATAANVATPQQYAEAAALQELGGTGVNVPLNQANLAQAGTAPTIPTLSNLNEQGLAQEYVNSLLGQAANSGAGGWNGISEFTGPNSGLVQPGTPAFTLAQYLQGIDPNAVSTVGAGNPFSGWDTLINNSVGAS